MNIIKGIDLVAEIFLKRDVVALAFCASWHCLDKDEQVEELVVHATLKPAQREFRHSYA
jgi:hypothetical protein